MLLSQTPKKSNPMQLSNKAIQLMSVCTLVFASSLVAAETQSVTASVTVQNTFTLSKSADLDFGTIAAFADSSGGGDTSTLIMPSDPAVTPSTTTGSGDSAIQILTNGSPATLSVTGAAPNTDLQVTLPTTPIALTAGGTAMNFSITALTTYATTYGGTTPNTRPIQTDGSGDMTFNIGGTIATTANTDTAGSVNEPYVDDTYSATFNVVVQY
ncbi:MAG: DUF4402 domain-containing protein [Hydrogenovibrio sp.]